jgi:hypothetical protein
MHSDNCGVALFVRSARTRDVRPYKIFSSPCTTILPASLHFSAECHIFSTHQCNKQSHNPEAEAIV